MNEFYFVVNFKTRRIKSFERIRIRIGESKKNSSIFR